MSLSALPPRPRPSTPSVRGAVAAAAPPCCMHGCLNLPSTTAALFFMQSVKLLGNVDVKFILLK